MPKADFEKNYWLRKPDELELRNVGFSWLDQGKAAVAVEVAKLNSEINPYIWNTWFNLGSAQRAAGQIQDRLASYRRVLELEPTNWNAPSLRLAQAEQVRPPVVRFGATLAEMEQALKPVSRTVNRVTPVDDASDPQQQSQLSCEGLEFMGARRKADFWFRDDKLQVVWIQTEGAETERLFERFSEALTPTFRRYKSYTAFGDSRVAIRTARPAVLFYSRDAAPEVLRWFETQ